MSSPLNTNAPSRPSTPSGCSTLEESVKNYVCPSTPRPLKMRVTIQDKHVLVPMENSDRSIKYRKISVDDFPSLPFHGFKSAAPGPMNDDAQQFNSCSSLTLTATDARNQHVDKHSSLERKQSLGHIHRRNKIFGARCA
eukprot:654760_1